MRSKYPQHVAEFNDVPRLLNEYVFNGLQETSLLADRSPIITQGSCFARNLAASFARHGGKVAHMNVNEFINTTHANRLFFHWVSGRDTVQAKQFRALFETQCTEDGREDFLSSIRAAAIFVLTVGVAPWWVHRPTGTVVLQPNKRQMADFEMRTSGVADNVKMLDDILNIIHEINPAIEIVVTLSPAPLNQTFEMHSTIVADCVSKSVLRVAIHEILQKARPKVGYWPSFEVVRWVGSHIGPAFGAEDGHPRHVSGFLVDDIVKAFMRRHGWTPEGKLQKDHPDEFGNLEPFVMHKNF